MLENPIITVEQVSFSYNSTPVIEKADFSVHENDYIAVIGPNGGGKSTMMKLILGLLGPDSGKISLFSQRPEAGRVHVGYVPQHFEFDFDFPMTALEVALMGRLSFKNIGQHFSESDETAALNALHTVGMEGFANRQIHELSGGERQRVLIARALAINPKCLILDEPASGIDVKWQENLHSLLEQLNKKMAILLISHHLDVICGHVDKVLFVNKEVHLYETIEEAVKHIGNAYGFPDTFTLKNICS